MKARDFESVRQAKLAATKKLAFFHAMTAELQQGERAMSEQEQKQFEALYASIPAITSTKQTALIAWQAASQGKQELLDCLRTILSDLEIGAHPHLHIEYIRAVIAKHGA